MSYRPGSRCARNLAARRPPSAYVIRLDDRCVISIRSPVPANITEWSPTKSPPRITEKPMLPGGRGPVNPWRPCTATCCSERPWALATSSPRRSAVPEGASTLSRWCASMISTSKSPDSIRAASSASRNATLTPTLMFGENTTGTLRAACSMCRRPASSKPVVPITAHSSHSKSTSLDILGRITVSPGPMIEEAGLRKNSAISSSLERFERSDEPIFSRISAWCAL